MKNTVKIYIDRFVQKCMYVLLTNILIELELAVSYL